MNELLPIFELGDMGPPTAFGDMRGELPFSDPVGVKTRPVPDAPFEPEGERWYVGADGMLSPPGRGVRARTVPVFSVSISGDVMGVGD